MTTTLRRGDDADLDPSGRLFEACGLPSWRRFALADGYRLWCAARGEGLIGAALCRRLDRETELLAIAIAPEHRRRGEATALLRRVIEDVRPDRLLLEVEDGNHAAIALYDSFGFATDGERPDYYRRSDKQKKALLMSRPASDAGPG